ncbi:hypothetical protein C2E23DRAFT_871453 [Lenzites betulinus]|nr:hypothetical protein C2E23DRAFT_871453 [Lenzites betulinus]
MEVLSRPRVFARPDMANDEPTPGPSMLAAPSSATRLPPRLPSVDHKLTIPARPPIASRRHSATVGSMSPSHLSRPLRSSPLAGPSIAATSDNPRAAVASAPPTPGGGRRHLSPLAESSNTILAEALPVVDTDVKKQRRRSLGAVLSKLSFPAATPTPSIPESESPVTPVRRRTKSTTSQEAPPVPPVPTWMNKTMPSRTRSPISPHASSSTTSPSRARVSPSDGSSPKSSRPTSPTPSARSATSSVKPTPDPRRASLRPPPSTSRSPEDNWLTQSAAPRFSRLGLKAEGVILPVSAREARRRSTASLASINGSKTRSSDTLPPPLPPPLPIPVRASSRASTASNGSLPRPSTAPASQQHFSRTSSRASLASAASASGSAMESGSMYYCDTPSLTMSPGPSASDVSLSSSRAPTVAEADEMGVLSFPQPQAFPMPHSLGYPHGMSASGSVVEIQLNDVPVGVLSVPAPAPAYMRAGKGKARATDIALVAPTDDPSELGAFPPWARGARAPSVVSSSAATSVVDLSRPGSHARAATAPELGADAKAKKRPHALGRMWGRVVRSVTIRR